MELRLGTVTGSTAPAPAQLLALEGSVNAQPSGRMLLDGGASLNFIDSSAAGKCGLSRRRLGRPVRVKMADGTQCRCEYVVNKAHIQVAEHSGYHDLVVMDRIDGFTLILGLPFLEHARVNVDFGRRTVMFGRVADEPPPEATTAPTVKGVSMAMMNDPAVSEVQFVRTVVDSASTQCQDEMLSLFQLACQPDAPDVG